MQTEELLSGYSDLITQFVLRVRTDLDFDNLRLVFSLEGDLQKDNTVDLVATDSKSSESMVVAIYNKKRGRWQHETLPGTDAWYMAHYFCQKYKVAELAKAMNQFFEDNLG